MRNNPLVRKLAPTNASDKVDILRLSHNVRKNIKREQDEEDSAPYQQPPSEQAEADDVSLNGNRKLVLNFGEDSESPVTPVSPPIDSKDVI